MLALALFALAGFAAQLVDGSLGMGYGMTSSTLLMLAGLTAASASASVHMAEVGTTAASAIAHWRLGNVDRRVLARIAVPGALGAFAGATVLASLSTQAARPWASAILLVLGVYVLFRFLRTRGPRLRPGMPGLRLLVPLGLVGGFVDATGGGGWGPVTTPTLLADGRMLPSKVVGTVNTAEFCVSLAAAIGFLLAMGWQALSWWVLLPLLVGGVVAAPIAARITHRLPVRVMGTVVGGMIVFSNSLTILRAVHAPALLMAGVLTALAVVWALLVVLAVSHMRRDVRTDEDRASSAPAQSMVTSAAG